jgi:hypothetical protein
LSSALKVANAMGVTAPWQETQASASDIRGAA